LFRVAVDIGGTFTDLVALDEESGRVIVLKLDSTPKTPEVGFLTGFSRILSEHSLRGEDIRVVAHVGTIGSNLFLGQIGLEMPRVALVTTEGFRDILEIGRQNRPQLYNLFFRRPKPLVERRFRFEVRERTDSHGSVLVAPDEKELDELAATIKTYGFDSVAVSFLNSYVNPHNERLLKERLEASLGISVHISCEVDPEHREYERTSTTVVNAVLSPVISRYVRLVSHGLQELGVDAPLYIMSSSGGVVDAEEVKARPICAIESGPAAGVVGAAAYASMLGEERVISLDMGGTTAKTSAIISSEPLLVQEFEVGGSVHLGRYVKGSGYPVRYPSVDLAEVSAGGGTIIWADEAGVIRAGPTSAGADPGPACYGKGGEMPTITDANLLLGRLGEKLLGGAVRLRRELAERAMAPVAERAGMELLEAAHLALNVANLHMSKAVRIVSLERGLDPRGFALMSFGGAGPMHAAELAELLEMKRVIIPPFPEVFSALGLLLTDLRYNYLSSFVRLLDSVRPEQLEEAFSKLESKAAEQLSGRNLQSRGMVVNRSMDLRYYGQGYELETPVSSRIDDAALQNIAREFENLHERSYGFKHSGERIEAVAIRLTVKIPVTRPRIRTPSGDGDPLLGRRQAYFDGELTEVEVYDRSSLAVGYSVAGPAIIEGYGSTVVIPARWQARLNEFGCILLER